MRDRVRSALLRLAADVATKGRIGGEGVKSTQGADDMFHRLRVGDHRVMHDVIEADRAVLVLGMVHRRDLERWLRNR